MTSGARMSGERHTDERRLLLTTVSVGNICEWAELRFELYKETGVICPLQPNIQFCFAYYICYGARNR